MGCPMSQAEPADQNRCTHCDNALDKVPCRACDAKGFIRRWLIFKDECWVCSGNGFRLRCPDELSHGPGYLPPTAQPEPARPWFFSHPQLLAPVPARYGSTHSR